MKKLLSLTLCVIFIIGVMPYCKKKKTCSETPMQVTTTPAIGSTEAPAPGPDFPLRVTISANMPAAGVTISVKARPDAGGNFFFTESRSSTSANNDFTIKNTPVTTVGLVEITVTSNGCSSNAFTGTYRYSRK